MSWPFTGSFINFVGYFLVSKSILMINQLCFRDISKPLTLWSVKSALSKPDFGGSGHQNNRSWWAADKKKTLVPLYTAIKKSVTKEPLYEYDQLYVWLDHRYFGRSQFSLLYNYWFLLRSSRIFFFNFEIRDCFLRDIENMLFSRQIRNPVYP